MLVNPHSIATRSNQASRKAVHISLPTSDRPRDGGSGRDKASRPAPLRPGGLRPRWVAPAGTSTWSVLRPPHFHVRARSCTSMLDKPKQFCVVIVVTPAFFREIRPPLPRSPKKNRARRPLRPARSPEVPAAPLLVRLLGLLGAEWTRRPTCHAPPSDRSCGMLARVHACLLARSVSERRP